MLFWLSKSTDFALSLLGKDKKYLCHWGTLLAANTVNLLGVFNIVIYHIEPYSVSSPGDLSEPFNTRDADVEK